MQRHDRATVRHQRERYMRRRRRQFAGWVEPIDWAAGHHVNHRGFMPINAPRPREIREAEFWTGARLGSLGKWNGISQGRSRRRQRRGLSRQARLERILVREMRGQA